MTKKLEVPTDLPCYACPLSFRFCLFPQIRFHDFCQLCKFIRATTLQRSIAASFLSHCLQDPIRPSRHPPYSFLYPILLGEKKTIRRACQMGIPSLLKVGFDGDSTVLLSDEVHLAIKACNKTLSEESRGKRQRGQNFNGDSKLKV